MGEASSTPESALKLFTRIDTQRPWRNSGDGSNAVFISLEAVVAARRMLLEGKHVNVVDFDDHLDDITKDWLNSKLMA